MRRLLKVGSILVGIAIAGVAVAIWLFLPPAATTRTAAYPSLLKAWSDTGLVDHFPQALPPNATDVSLFADPGFLQGSGSFQLRMTLPKQDVQDILTRMKTTAVRSCPSQCTRSVEDPQFWNIPRLAAGQKDDVRFPPDFVVFALDTNGEWNHPRGKGVAISIERHEVVYWAEV